MREADHTSGRKFDRLVLKAVRKIPEGKVTTYGIISDHITGGRRYARHVGHALASLQGISSQRHRTPWWRVVNSKGEFGVCSSSYDPCIEKPVRIYQISFRPGDRIGERGSRSRQAGYLETEGHILDGKRLRDFTESLWAFEDDADDGDEASEPNSSEEQS